MSLEKIKAKKKLIVKISSTVLYALGVICICFGVIGVNVIKNNSDTGKDIKAVNENLNKTVSTKELMTSYQNLAKEQQKKEAAVKAKKAREAAVKEMSSVISSVSYTKSEYLSYAYDLVINQYGWSEADYSALVKLWNRESGWNANSHSGTGAHGIPQALPASKMASEGSDYYSNGKTQIRWGLKYIVGKYGSPSRAWEAFQSKGWY